MTSPPEAGMSPRLERWYGSRRRLVDRELARLTGARLPAPPGLKRAMRYSLLGPGKRLRPALALAACEACGGRTARGLPYACAVELVHAYSLVHDDLPSMDDDDLRRGRPTSHKVFGEAEAILAGDALLTLAFETAAAAPGPEAGRAAALLARAAGAAGMVGGQSLDLKAHGRMSSPAGRNLVPRIHELKTAALIGASLELGGLAAGAGPAQRRALRGFGRHAGLAFQIVDDVLEADSGDALGKSASDRRNAKLTYPAVFGLERSRRMAAERAALASRALKPLGRRAWMLHELAAFIVSRRR